MKRNITIISWFNFFTDFVLFAPVAIIYFSKVSGSYALGMSVFSVAYVSSALFELPTGIMSDLVGRKRTMILGAFVSVLCVILYASSNSFITLCIGALFQGLSRAFYSGNNDALLHDTLKQLGKEKEIHHYLGRSSSMFQVALAVSSLIGGFVAYISLPLVMWLSVIPQVLAFVLTLFIVNPKVTDKVNTNVMSHLGESVKYFIGNYKLRLISISSIINFALGESTYFLRSAFIATLWPIWAIGIAQMFSNAVGALGFYYGGKAVEKYGEKSLLYADSLASRVANLVALIFPNILSPILMSSTSLLYGLRGVAVGSIFQKEFNDRQRATLGSLNAFVGSIAFGICAVSAGWFADIYGPTMTLIIANVGLLLPLVAYRYAFKKN